MSNRGKPVLDVLQGRLPYRRPVWLMRQAGRYLPEYLKVRGKAEDFINLCLNTELATEITLQPIKRFGMDAAILFADILLLPLALGVKVEFLSGEGPSVEVVRSEDRLGKLFYDGKKVKPVFRTVKEVYRELDKDTALIGFCGAPWTVVCYMIDGNSKGGFEVSREFVKQRSDFVRWMISTVVDASIEYVCSQIEAGAEVIQIFDSWAGLLDDEDFYNFVIEPTRILVAGIRGMYPNIPVIGFPRGAGKNYERYACWAGVDCLGIDQFVDVDYAKENLRPVLPLQGNLDPEVLLRGGDEMKLALRKIMDTFGKEHILNLGHGVLPNTPVENVAEMVRFIRGYEG